MFALFTPLLHPPGDGTNGMDDMEEDLQKFNPLNLYGWSKHKFDLLAQKNGWLERIVGLKYFNVYGPNEEHKGDMQWWSQSL